MASELECPPTNSTLLVMRNLDQHVDYDVAKYLRKNRDEYAQYAAWDFCGRVWITENDIWACEVWVYRVAQCVIVADTLEQLMEKCRQQFGDD